jgi:hypothetical protein
LSGEAGTGFAVGGSGVKPISSSAAFKRTVFLA